MIEFHYEEIDFQLENKEAIQKWIASIINRYDYEVKSINYIFCNDEYLLKINQDFLSHNYYTDIITFDNSEEFGIIEADLFISIERVMENATDNLTSFTEELCRVMIHGILHLLGYKDKTEAESQEMRQKEEECLSLLSEK